MFGFGRKGRRARPPEARGLDLAEASLDEPVARPVADLETGELRCELDNGSIRTRVGDPMVVSTLMYDDGVMQIWADSDLRDVRGTTRIRTTMLTAGVRQTLGSGRRGEIDLL